MKVFWCDNCGQLVFFENSQCVSCGMSLGFVPDALEMRSFDFSAIDPANGTLANHPDWRLCANYRQHDTCNWMVAADDENPLCRSCRLTRVIPNLEVPENVTRWFRLEGAKRRLLFTLLMLKLPADAKREPAAPEGLAFEFLADPAPGAPCVMTGHDQGTITINIAEADDAERERRRAALKEPYRTLLGHMRHEVGHYYWDRLIRDGNRLDGFRKVFGDERADYAAALQQHYAAPVSLAWQSGYVSDYASAHPWEDWAESWAHYLHIWDLLETAGFAGLRLRPKVKEAPSVKIQSPPEGEPPSFDQMIADFFPLTYVINNLNRGLGQPDGYPFILSPLAVEKLRFVHETIQNSALDEKKPGGKLASAKSPATAAGGPPKK